ncbi:hypothetical protein E4U60_007712 [Claviceps pazoutovae]|uniref:C2H2-type domain-containing protein n=1 Tax=Claviceps pazoutovae TaxID=1649127 RepID=A0A9P7SHX9_9HYPO|nr:hypothetical protein E4U60_007712 [Claviceps pazoutovae]
MVMHDSHMGFAGQVDSSRSSNDDMASIHLDFDTLLSADHMNPAFNAFDTCIHDDSCLHFMQPHKPQKRFTNEYASTPPKTASSASTFSRPQSQAKRQDRNSSKAVSQSTSMDQSQGSSWDHIFTESVMAGCTLPCGGGFERCQDDDCVSVMSCSSACEGSCPSQCGETTQAVCCDGDACGSPQLCLDDDCPAESQPCTDVNCIVDTSTMQSHQTSFSPTLSDGDKAAAAALASFGDCQSQLFQSAYMQHPQQHLQSLPGTSREGDMNVMNFPNSFPCGNLSMDSILTNFNGTPNLPDQPFQMAFEYALANHIMQYHDPAHGLAQQGSCIANDPSQLITKCTLPKFNPNDLANTDPFMPQIQTHECGFPIQDPNEFAHHIFQEHRPSMMVHAHQYGFNEPSHSHSNSASHHHQYGFSEPSHSHSHSHSTAHSHHHGGHDDPWFNFSAASNSTQFSPSMSPLTNLSMGPSLSETPVSIPTPSPLEPEPSFRDAATTNMAQATSCIAESKIPVVAQDDPYTCRWIIGPGSSFVCGMRFDNDEQLQKHCKNDHLKQLKKLNGGFTCGWAGCARDTCFSQRSKVERHMQVHTGYKPVQCSICGAALSAKQALDQHMRIHTGETPWVCKVPGCGCAFKQQSALTMHERTHTGDKPLECEICGKRFSESSNLSKHRRTHNVKGMHECQLCGKDFHRLDQLRRHMGTNHKDRPAEVDALLSATKSRIRAQKVSKLKSSAVKKKKKTRVVKTLVDVEDDDEDDGDAEEGGEKDDDVVAEEGMSMTEE